MSEVKEPTGSKGGFLFRVYILRAPQTGREDSRCVRASFCSDTNAPEAKKVTNKEVINKAALGKEKQRNTVNSSRVTFHLQNNSESRCRTSTVFSKSTLVGCRFSQQQHRVLDGCKSAL